MRELLRQPGFAEHKPRAALQTARLGVTVHAFHTSTVGHKNRMLLAGLEERLIRLSNLSVRNRIIKALSPRDTIKGHTFTGVEKCSLRV